MNTSTQLPLTNSPKNLVQASFSVPLIKQMLFASMDVQYLSKRLTRGGQYTGSYVLPNFTLFQPGHLKEMGNLSDSFYNAFNQKYSGPGRERSGGGRHPSGWPDISVQNRVQVLNISHGIFACKDDMGGDWVGGDVFLRGFNSRRNPASFLLHRRLLFFLNPLNAVSVNEESLEYPLKLAFLYNFTKFIEWPSDSFHDPGSSLAICIIGNDPFNPDLEAELRTRTVGSHPVEIKTLRSNDPLGICHMVFVPVTEKSQVARIVSGLKGSSTLTVGEIEGFAVQGGIINLTIEENKLHFEVNPLAAWNAPA